MTIIVRDLLMLRLSAFSSLCLLLSAGPAHEAAAASPRLLPTEVPAIKSVAGPAEGFDPVRATDDERAAYGFPPAPDAARHPQGYAKWVRAMRASRTRITPKLALNAVRHGAMRPGSASKGVMSGAIVHGITYGQAFSSNWSGAVLVNSATSFGAHSFYLAGSGMMVPAVSQPAGTCTEGWLYSSGWVGLDGASGYSQDVLQAGYDADAYCSYGYTMTNYDVWYEWAPADGVVVQNLTVSAGQELYVVVWATSATQGNAYIVNESTGQNTSVQFTPPAGTSLTGNSADFVMERPEVNNKLSSLADYTEAYFSFGYVFDNSNVTSFPAIPAAPAQALQVTMQDSSGNAISNPEILGGASIVTLAAGSAQ
jgi:hypothetical protein